MIRALAVDAGSGVLTIVVAIQLSSCMQCARLMLRGFYHGSEILLDPFVTSQGALEVGSLEISY